MVSPGPVSVDPSVRVQRVPHLRRLADRASAALSRFSGEASD
ncbi:hypothetical protein O4J56_31845 [Nocardiopsis sp. RSe5-2]|uniref:Uncharacterized protein n=1 Tax=Nocardiopsis endophytica TaxID=3018445 RepID=A0ABT4UEB2_9ACTN|nr:hypothetical protein [Nocardiopsis endophytica]MDA2815278.1 hypothetical protein [Nocardiopsis endophytica]